MVAVQCEGKTAVAEVLWQYGLYYDGKANVVLDNIC